MAYFQVKFKFENSEIAIFEIKRTDLSSTAPVEERYHWFFFDRRRKSIQRLGFQFMSKQGDQNFRMFEDSTLSFNLSSGEYRKNSGETFELRNTSAQPLSVDLKSSIRQFLFTTSDMPTPV